MGERPHPVRERVCFHAGSLLTLPIVTAPASNAGRASSCIFRAIRSRAQRGSACRSSAILLGKAVQAAALDVYEQSCPRQTPRQIEAYAVSRRGLAFRPKTPQTASIVCE